MSRRARRAPALLTRAAIVAAPAVEARAARLRVRGVVQGVGFRPFVYGVATRLGLAGWVRNTSAGVEIAVEGPAESIEGFARALREQAPPLARIDDLLVEDRPPQGLSGFTIEASAPLPGAVQPVPPDVGVCADCLHELFDPADRRYRYPFTNCTNCGPRFTIIRDLPYDRPLTTMAAFPLCPDCAAEYHDPGDRRFHAQPVACSACGPRLWLELDGARAAEGEQALADVRRMIAGGAIVALKGLGGFHLACDATQPQAVAELRARKLRVDKPFALMLPDLESVAEHCVLDDAARHLLDSPAKPIVLLDRKPGSPIAAAVAPGQATLGVMLPYTPLHHLLLARAPGVPEAWVMTSGNLSEEPITAENGEARARLAGLADAFLMHDREIHTRCDDSVVRVFEGAPYPLRRARGYAPFPLRLTAEAPALLGAGAELKNTFCLTRGGYAFLSHHIGDLENFETLSAYEDGIRHYERLFRARPQALAHDLHPDYLSTRYAAARAAEQDLPAFGVQHHHAHIAACMAEHGLHGEQPVIGVAFDGTGYGEDGTIWGGEFLIADYAGFRRAAHLATVPLPGGDAATRAPWRTALAWLTQAGIPWDEDLPPVSAAPEAERRVIGQMLVAARRGTPGLAPRTSSAGRLFDAAAALAGVRSQVNYEAQAAMEFEALVDPHEAAAYPFALVGETVDAAPVLRQMVHDLRAGVGVPALAARFHNGLAEAVARMCARLRDETGLARVALSGGVWQNRVLLEGAVRRLRGLGFDVLVHRQVPANDAGVAFGQVVVAAARLRAAGGLEM